jgi:hypothetical protein
MKEIQHIGAFLPQDEQGFIINNLSLSLIDKPWQAVIQAIILFYKKELSTSLHSVYVRGSVATGRAVKGISDIDTFALIHSTKFIRWKTPTFHSQLEHELQTDFQFINGVEANLASFHSDFYNKNPRLSMIIQTQSLCVFGESIAPTFPQFKAGKVMCLNSNWLKEDIQVFQQKLYQKTNTLADCQAIMKVIIRSGFELVIEKEQRFTADLYLCYKTFSKYFPIYEPAMRQALDWFLNPIINQKSLLFFLQNLGTFLITEIQND